MSEPKVLAFFGFFQFFDLRGTFVRSDWNIDDCQQERFQGEGNRC